MNIEFPFCHTFIFSSNRNFSWNFIFSIFWFIFFQIFIFLQIFFNHFKQASITSLSTWFLNNRKNGEALVNAWVGQLNKSDHEHRLTLLFVANDVVQNCRKKAPEMKGKNQKTRKPVFFEGSKILYKIWPPKWFFCTAIFISFESLGM